MANMSYCRFENTVNDMHDCIDALEEADYDMEVLQEDASEYERGTMEEFIKLCKQVASNSE